MLIVTLGKSLGVALGFALTGWLFGLLTDFSAPGWLADLAPWRSTHVLLAAISAMCLLPLLLLREPERREVEASRSEEHTSELQSLMRSSYAVFCLKKKKKYS